MQIQVIQNSKFNITAYDQTSVTINEQKYSQSIFITSKNIQKLAEKIPSIKQLSLSALPLLDEIQILIIGGQKISPLDMPIELQTELQQQNISLEVMELGSACRTFNLLLSEGRDVACLIFLGG